MAKTNEYGGERIANQEVLDMLKPEYDRIFGNEGDLKNFCNLWSATGMENYSPQNVLYFIKQQEQRGDKTLRYVASRTTLERNYYMDLKGKEVGNPLKVLVPITVSQKYGFDKVYNKVLSVLDGKADTYKIEGADLYFYKENDGISCYQMKSKKQLLKSIDEKELFSAIKAICNASAAEWKIANVYSIDQCVPQSKVSGGNHDDTRAIIFHEQVPGEIEEKSIERKNLLNAVIKQYAHENGINLESAGLKETVEEVLDKRFDGYNDFQKNIATYMIKRKLGFNPEFTVKIPEGYKNNTFIEQERRQILDDIKDDYKSVIRAIEHNLEEQNVDIKLVNKNSYQEVGLTRVELQMQSEYFKSRLPKFEKIAEYAEREINFGSRMDRSQIDYMVRIIATMAINCEKLAEYSNVLVNDSVKMQDKEAAYKNGSRVIAKLEKFEQIIDKSIEMHSQNLKRALEQELNTREVDFVKKYRDNPIHSLLIMKEDGHPKLQRLTKNEITYIAKSNYIHNNYAKFQKSDFEKFLDRAIVRLDKVREAVSKNGVFVEVNFSENVLQEKFFSTGDVLGLKEFNKKVEMFEKAIQKNKKEFEMHGKEFPSSNCNVTVFAPQMEKSRENAANYKIDDTKMAGFVCEFEIGDGENKNFKDVLMKMPDELLEAGMPEQLMRNMFNAIDKTFRERNAVTREIKKDDKEKHIEVSAREQIER